MNRWVQELPEEKLSTYMDKNREALLKRYPTDDEYFALWLHHLNRAVQRKLPLQFDDLEDWDFWAAYDGDLTPKEAAEDMLDDLGYDFE